MERPGNSGCDARGDGGQRCADHLGHDSSVNSGATSADIPVTVGDIETPARNLIVWATTSNSGLVPTNNIALGGANENRLLSVTPLAGTGSAVITLRVRDEANAESTTNITITVNAAPGRTYANTAAITIRDNNTATPYGSTILVDNPPLDGVVSQIIVTLDGVLHLMTSTSCLCRRVGPKRC